jgi:hypothetical protein
MRQGSKVAVLWLPGSLAYLLLMQRTRKNTKTAKPIVPKMAQRRINPVAM